MEKNGINIRLATISDINDLTRFRLAMFNEMKFNLLDKKKEMFIEACKEFFSNSIKNKDFISWVAEYDGNMIASSGLVFLQKPPSPDNLSGKEAYIMNMYTHPSWRKKGLATKLMNEIISYIQKMNITHISLHATEIGVGVYEKLGFEFTNSEMKLKYNYLLKE